MRGSRPTSRLMPPTSAITSTRSNSRSRRLPRAALRLRRRRRRPPSPATARTRSGQPGRTCPRAAHRSRNVFAAGRSCGRKGRRGGSALDRDRRTRSAALVARRYDRVGRRDQRTRRSRGRRGTRSDGCPRPGPKAVRVNGSDSVGRLEAGRLLRPPAGLSCVTDRLSRGICHRGGRSDCTPGNRGRRCCRFFRGRTRGWGSRNPRRGVVPRRSDDDVRHGGSDDLHVAAREAAGNGPLADLIAQEQAAEHNRDLARVSLPPNMRNRIRSAIPSSSNRSKQKRSLPPKMRTACWLRCGKVFRNM